MLVSKPRTAFTPPSSLPLQGLFESLNFCRAFNICINRVPGEFQRLLVKHEAFGVAEDALVDDEISLGNVCAILTIIQYLQDLPLLVAGSWHGWTAILYVFCNSQSQNGNKDINLLQHTSTKSLQSWSTTRASTRYHTCGTASHH
jgi:hypothetical protein